MKQHFTTNFAFDSTSAKVADFHFWVTFDHLWSEQHFSSSWVNYQNSHVAKTNKAYQGSKVDYNPCTLSLSLHFLMMHSMAFVFKCSAFWILSSLFFQDFFTCFFEGQKTFIKVRNFDAKNFFIHFLFLCSFVCQNMHWDNYKIVVKLGFQTQNKIIF